MPRILTMVLVFLMIPALPLSALDGLSGLQEAALSDQDTECMVHEYSRRYNEVLREFSRGKKKLSKEGSRKAHEEAMGWVESVWKYADQKVVQRNLKSKEFLSAAERFRASQESQYPDLSVVR